MAGVRTELLADCLVSPDFNTSLRVRDKGPFDGFILEGDASSEIIYSEMDIEVRQNSWPSWEMNCHVVQCAGLSALSSDFTLLSACTNDLARRRNNCLFSSYNGCRTE